MNNAIFSVALRKVLTAVGGAFVILSSQCWAYDNYRDFISFSIGSTGESTPDLDPSQLKQTLTVDSGQAFTLGYGFQENHLRILLELSAVTTDAQTTNSSAESGSATSYSVFYNVFWVPSIEQYHIAALIGGGIGYSQNKLEDIVVGNAAPQNLTDTGWSAKFGLGLEYSPLSNLGVQLMYQSVMTDKVQDDEIPGWSVADLDHDEISLGALYRF